MKSKLDILFKAAEKAIDALFSDDSASVEDTIDALDGLRMQIEDKISALAPKLGKKSK